jgi:PAS domain S-box-containing protein
MEYASDAIFWMNRDGSVAYVNEQACRSLGYEREELLRLHLWQIDPDTPEARWHEAWPRLAETGSFHAETRHRRKDGSVFPVEVSAKFITYAGRTYEFAFARDISGRKRSEAALRRSEERLRQAISVSGIGIFDHDHRADTIYWSPEVRKILGWGPDEARGVAAFLGLVHPEDREAVGAAIRRAQDPADDGLYDAEYRIVRADGELRWLAAKAQTLFESDRGTQRPVRTVGALLDLTARKLAEEASRQSAARYRLLFEANPHAMWVYDLASLAFLAVNDAAVAHYGYSRDEFLAMTIKDIRPPEDVAKLLSNVAQVSAGIDQAGAWRHRLKDGRIIEVEVTSHTLEFLGRRAELVLALDVTERLRAERALKASEHRFRAVVQNAQSIIFILDRDGRFMLSEGLALAKLGLAPGEVVGRLAIDMYRDYPSVVNSIGKALAGELSRGDDVIGEVVFDTVYSPYYDADGGINGVIGVAVDITDRRRADEALKELNATLELRVAELVAKTREKDHLLIQQSRLAAMGEMIGNIAHQWRQPINALALLLMNLKDAQQFGEMTDQYLASQIERGDQLIRKMSTTIDDFRNFFRPHRDKQAFLLSAAVHDALSIIESAYEQHRIEIEVSIREDAAVLGFPNEYTQVLLNLLSNAKEAIEARKVARGRVQIVIDCDGREARLTVRDNGGGIPSDVLPKIFDPYFTTRDGGTGIGLYMSKMIIESSMKGGIEARNTTDGAEFSVLTPVMRGAAAAMDTGLADA